MKYIKCFFLYIIICILLVGCLNINRTINEEDKPLQTDSTSKYTQTISLSSLYPSHIEDEIVIGFSQLGSESDWRLANSLSIVEAAKEAGIELKLVNAEQSQEAQFKAIRQFIEEEVDLIAIAPVIQTGWESILLEVKEAGIPVVIIDRSVNVKDTSLYVTFIGSDFYDEGIKAGKYALDKMRNHIGKVRIAELQGTVDSTPSIDRGRGFRDIIKTRDEMEIELSHTANFTLEEGKRVMNEFLVQSGEDYPHMLFAHNDDMALGAIQAIEEHGLIPGKDIIIVSVDGTRQALEMMVEGKINAVVECNPLLGPLLMQAAREIMAGRSIPKRIIPPEDIYTPEFALQELNNRKY